MYDGTQFLLMNDPAGLTGGDVVGPGSATANNLVLFDGTTGKLIKETTTGTGVVTFLGTPSSANLAAAVTDETGSGALVFANSPTLISPDLGTPNSGTVTHLTGTASININGTVGATTPNTGAFTTATLSSNLTLNGGTANGVLFLNGSKVATSGSALTFDGTNLGLSNSAVATFVEIDGSGRYKQFEAHHSGTREFVVGYDSTDLNAFVSTDFNRPILFRIAGVEVMRLASTGLGIGTTSAPTKKLEVASSDALIHSITVGRGAGSISTNVALGASALGSNSTGSSNTGIGFQAGSNNTVGTDNTAVGNYALGFSGTNTASGLVAVGSSSLRNNTSGTANTAVGSGVPGSFAAALQENTTGSNNTALGNGAMGSNQSGSYNTASGYQALFSNTIATSSTAVGFQALLNSNRTSDTNGYNTAIGYSSGSALTTGNKNSILGSYTGNQGGLDIRTASNYIVLSDGDGNPQLSVPANGSLQYGITTARGSFSFANVSSVSQDLATLFPNLGFTFFGISVELQVLTQSSPSAATSTLIHGHRNPAGTWSFSNFSTVGSGATVTPSATTTTLTLSFSSGFQFGRCVVNIITQA
jgi:hypothetical protein